MSIMWSIKTSRGSLRAQSHPAGYVGTDRNGVTWKVEVLNTPYRDKIWTKYNRTSKKRADFPGCCIIS